MKSLGTDMRKNIHKTPHAMASTWSYFSLSLAFPSLFVLLLGSDKSTPQYEMASSLVADACLVGMAYLPSRLQFALTRTKPFVVNRAHPNFLLYGMLYVHGPDYVTIKKHNLVPVVFISHILNFLTCVLYMVKEKRAVYPSNQVASFANVGITIAAHSAALLLCPVLCPNVQRLMKNRKFVLLAMATEFIVQGYDNRNLFKPSFDVTKRQFLERVVPALAMYISGFAVVLASK